MPGDAVSGAMMGDKNGNASAGPKPCYVTVHISGPDGETRSFPADQGTQERWESIRQLILAKEAELAARRPPPKPVGKETIVLYPTPDLFDLDGWRQHLEWLRTEPLDIVARAAAIEHAEDWIAMLESPMPPQRPTEAD